MDRFIHVVIGVIHNAAQQFFIAKRPPHVVMPGYWEFPGGKMEMGESQLQTLIREFHEEAGITVEQAHYLQSFTHHFSDRQVILHVWQIQHYSGIACGNEGQEIRWVDRLQLGDFDFLPSNGPLLTYLIQTLSCSATLESSPHA